MSGAEDQATPGHPLHTRLEVIRALPGIGDPGVGLERVCLAESVLELGYRFETAAVLKSPEKVTRNFASVFSESLQVASIFPDEPRVLEAVMLHSFSKLSQTSVSRKWFLASSMHVDQSTNVLSSALRSQRPAVLAGISLANAGERTTTEARTARVKTSIYSSFEIFGAGPHGIALRQGGNVATG